MLGPPDKRRHAVEDTAHSQAREQLYFNIKSGLLVSTRNSETMHLIPLHEGDRERERGGANACVTYQDDEQLEERDRCPLCMLSGRF